MNLRYVEAKEASFQYSPTITRKVQASTTWVLSEKCSSLLGFRTSAMLASIRNQIRPIAMGK
eukprot:1159777-Pelagomonas_calceolata.AAC.4